MFGFRKRELRRTCKRCQTSWFVPRQLAWKFPDGHLGRACNRVTATHQGTLSAYMIEQAELIRLTTCPGCGSGRYSERYVR